MGVDPTERLPQGIQGIDNVLRDIEKGKTMEMARVHQLLTACRAVIHDLGEHCKELDISLTAAVSGELPERYSLNQYLLARRAKAYIRWLETTKDPRDKLVT